MVLGSHEENDKRHVAAAAQGANWPPYFRIKASKTTTGQLLGALPHVSDALKKSQNTVLTNQGRQSA
jgi:hypothetical protein